MSEDPKGNTDSDKQIADRWRELQQTVALTAAQAGRSGESVTILGVTKYVDAAVARLVAAAGTDPLAIPLTIIGEVVAGAGLFLRQPDGGRQPLEPRGFVHAFDG